MSKNLSKKYVAALVVALSFAAPQSIMSGAYAESVITGITNGGSGSFNIDPARTNGDFGFRDYVDFKLGQGDVANLNFNGIEHFVNLVDNQININGIVNTVRGGAFHNGEAIFVSPNGMVVGETGVLNVGSLSVLTPTQQGMQLYKNGDATLEQLGYHGNADITINGRILSRGDVSMIAKGLTVGQNASILAGAGGTSNNTIVNSWTDASNLFQSLVNTGANTNSANMEFRTYRSGGHADLKGNITNYGEGDVVIINRGTGGLVADGTIAAHGGDVYLTNGDANMTIGGVVSASNGALHITSGSQSDSMTIASNADLSAKDLVEIVHNGSANYGATTVDGNITSQGNVYITERTGNLNINGQISNQNGNIVISSNGEGASGLNIGADSVISSSNGSIRIANTGNGGLTLDGKIQNSGSTAITNRAGDFTVNGSVENTSGKINLTNTGNKLTLGASSSIVGGGDEVLIQNTGAGGFEANGSIKNTASTFLQNTNGAMNINGTVENSGDVLYIANTRNGSGLTIASGANISNDNSLQILNTGTGGMTIDGTVYNEHNGDRGTAITNRNGNMSVNGTITSKDGNINLTNVGNGLMTINDTASIGSGNGELTIQNTSTNGLTLNGTVNNKGTAYIYNKQGDMHIGGTVVNSEGGLYITNAADSSTMYLDNGSTVKAAGIGSKLNILNKGAGGMNINGTITDTGKTLITNQNGNLNVNGIISNKSGQLNITNTGGGALNIAGGASVSNDTNRIYITNQGAGGMNVNGQVVGQGHILLTNRNGGMNVTSNVTSGKANVVLTNTGNEDMVVSGTVTGQKVTATSKGNDIVIGNADTDQVALNGTQKVAITVENGSLRNAGSESDLIKTSGDLYVNVTNGTIGEEVGGKDLTKSINVNVGRRIKAFTNKTDGSNNDYNINLASENADMNVDRIKADGTLRLDTNGSILNASTDLANYANVKGTTIQLFANGTIGTADNALHFRQTDASKQSNVIAGGDVNLHHRGEALGEDVNFDIIGSETGNVTADLIKDGVINNIVSPGEVNVKSRRPNANLIINNQTDDTSLIKDYL